MCESCNKAIEYWGYKLNLGRTKVNIERDRDRDRDREKQDLDLEKVLRALPLRAAVTSGPTSAERATRDMRDWGPLNMVGQSDAFDSLKPRAKFSLSSDLSLEKK